jgi:Ca2+-binding EF-hand superfamily protein
VQTPAGQIFTRHELQGIYAAFKENDMRLPREYFNIVYSTYARLDNPILVGRVFDLFDKNHDGYFEYDGGAACTGMPLDARRTNC